ncbi:hypothetical protein F5888DRAFT_1638229 [Russula emetica]|nr:hypothetical protein F5888DRAFT_1638229 [Russula emetica]
MSQSRPNPESKALSNSNYQHLFSVALESYKKRTGKDLTSNPLLPRLETCNSPDAVIALLREQIPGFDQSRSDDDSERLSKWLNPTVNVIVAFSGTISDFVSPAFPPAGFIFTGIAVLLSAATAVNNRRNTLVIIFERIENVFGRLENYIEYPRTAGMINAIVKVMVEVLCILAIATKEINENRAKTYLRKLVGKTDIEDALLRLENAILEETRMAAAEALKGIHVIQDRMRGVEGMLEGVGDMLQGFDERMKDISKKGINSAQITFLSVIFTIHNIFMVRCRERGKSDGK